MLTRGVAKSIRRGYDDVHLGPREFVVSRHVESAPFTTEFTIDT